MRCYAKINGHYIGCVPFPVAGKTGDDQYPVYQFGQNGDTRTGPPGAYEELEATEHPDQANHYDLLFVMANREFSLTPFGPATRVAGTGGLWEMLTINTETDGLNFAWRNENGAIADNMVLTIEVKQ